MKKLSLITGLLFSCLMHSQNPTFQWVKSIGGATTENGIQSTIDVSGNVYITGSFQGTVDFDPGSGISNLTSAGSKDIFVQKFSSSGQFMWAKRIGGTSEDVGTSITTDKFEDVIVTGNFKGIVDFNPNSGYSYLTSNGGSDIFIQKLSPDGDLKWAESEGGMSSDYGGTVKTDESGNIYLVQNFSGIADFDPGRSYYPLTSNGSDDISIQKLNLSGTLIWVKSIGGSLSDIGKSISIDNSGNVYVTGYYQSTVDFDPESGINLYSSYGAEDIFIQKLNSNGNLVWVECMGGTGSDKGTSLSLDLSGNIYVTGSFQGTLHYFDSEGGGPTLLNAATVSSAGGSDMFIQKITPGGNVSWIKQIGGEYNDYGTSIYMDYANNIFASGGTMGIEINNPTQEQSKSLSVLSVESVFIQEFNSSGDLIWSGDFESSARISLNLLVTDYFDNLYLIGKYSGTVDFDPGTGTHNLTSNGPEAMYVLKLGQGVTSIKENTFENTLTVYPNPAKDKLTINLGDTYKNVKVGIYDATGHLVYSEESVESDQLNFAITQAPGVYFVNIQVDNKRITKKLIIE
jgi:hypothetical protein